MPQRRTAESITFLSASCDWRRRAGSPAPWLQPEARSRQRQRWRADGQRAGFTVRELAKLAAGQDQIVFSSRTWNGGVDFRLSVDAAHLWRARCSAHGRQALHRAADSASHCGQPLKVLVPTGRSAKALRRSYGLVLKVQGRRNGSHSSFNWRDALEFKLPPPKRCAHPIGFWPHHRLEIIIGITASRSWTCAWKACARTWP